MNKRKTLKYTLVVVGIISLLGWMGVGDTIQGDMMFMAALVIALATHLIEPKKEETKVGVSEIRVEEPPQKTKEELEKEQLETRLAELNKKPLPEAPKPEKTVEICPICQKECRNKVDYARHLAFKHFDKIKLEAV